MTAQPTTQITTHNPVRSDVPATTTDAGAAPTTPTTAATSRRWAHAGIAAGVCAIGALAASWAVTSVYDEKLAGDADAIARDLEGSAGVMVAFHVLETLGALLVVVFAAGLFRRLRAALPADSLLPAVSAAGLLGTSVVMVMAGGLDTEFAFAAADPGLVVPEALVVYNHWIGTIPGCWVLAGLTGLGLYAASRQGAVPRWIGRTGLVLGGLTALFGVSPLQYMAGLTGTLMLLVVAVGFAAGDRRAA